MFWLYMSLSAVGMWLIIGALFYWYEETSNNVLYNILDRAITLPWLAIFAVFVVAWYPFLLIWKFFRNAFRGVSVGAWETHHPAHYFNIGNLYFCYDNKARALCNKIYLVRVVRPKETF